MGTGRGLRAVRGAAAVLAGALLAFAATPPVLAGCLPGPQVDLSGDTSVGGIPDRIRTVGVDLDETIIGLVEGEGLLIQVSGSDYNLTNEAIFDGTIGTEGILAINADGGDVCYNGLAGASLSNDGADGIGLEIVNTATTGTVSVFSAHDIDAESGIVVDTVDGANTISVTAGTITADFGPGIWASSFDGAITIDVSAGVTIDAFAEAIYAIGEGGISITSAGTLVSDFDGIAADAINSNVAIFSTGTIETTGLNGIVASVTGNGDVTIGSSTQRTGAITSGGAGISVFGAVGDVEIFSGGAIDAIVGIGAVVGGDGDVLIDSAGDIESVGFGILVSHTGDNGNVTIRTAAGTAISVSDPTGIAGITVQRMGGPGSLGTVVIDNRADIVMDNGVLGQGDDTGILASLCECVGGGMTITNRGDITASFGIDAISTNSLDIKHLDGRITSSQVGIMAESFDAFGMQTPLINIRVGAGAEIVADTGIAIGYPELGSFNPTNIVIAGSVSGTRKALDLGLGADVLTLEPGYELIGKVDGQTGNDTLVLGGNEGSETFDLDDFGTQFTSFQDFRKRGTSTWTVTGSGSSFSTPVTVEAGRLNVSGDAMHFAPVLVQAGAVLGGNGDVDDAELFGTLAPGNSIGTINATKSGSRRDRPTRSSSMRREIRTC